MSDTNIAGYDLSSLVAMIPAPGLFDWNAPRTLAAECEWTIVKEWNECVDCGHRGKKFWVASNHVTSKTFTSKALAREYVRAQSRFKHRTPWTSERREFDQENSR